jgi:hypothetical protein
LVADPSLIRRWNQVAGIRSLGKGDAMFSKTQKLGIVAAIAGILAVGVVLKTSNAAGQATTAAAPNFTPQSKPVAAGEYEAKKLLILMDADKSGAVSKKEFMDFMAAEFDRLDTNHDGMLDVKELEESQLMQAHHGGGHR